MDDEIPSGDKVTEEAGGPQKRQYVDRSENTGAGDERLSRSIFRLRPSEHPKRILRRHRWWRRS